MLNRRIKGVLVRASLKISIRERDVLKGKISKFLKIRSLSVKLLLEFMEWNFNSPRSWNEVMRECDELVRNERSITLVSAVESRGNADAWRDRGNN